MTTLRKVLRFGFLLAVVLVRTGNADGIRQVQEPGDAPGVRVETSEARDAAGNRYEVETRTDGYGWRSRAVRALAPEAAGHRAGSIDVPIEPDASASVPSGWQSIGPDGGDVLTLAVSPLDPRIVLAGLDHPYTAGLTPRPAVFRSTDGGQTWAPALVLWNPGSFYQVVRHLTFAADGSAYAASSSGLWRSDNAGVNWHRLPNDSYRPDVRTVAVEPGDPRHIWIGLLSGTVLRSLDGGASFQSVPVPVSFQYPECRSIAFDRVRPGMVFVCFGTYEHGQVWVSSNAGASWVNRSAGLPDNPMNVLVHDGTRLLLGAGGIYYADGGGIFASPDDGQHWTPLSTGWPTGTRPRAVLDIAVDSSNPCVIWVATPRGMHRSSNCGTSWTFFVGRSHDNVFAVALLPGSVALQGAESYGVRRREGEGYFEPSSRGMRALALGEVAANPLDPRELAAGFEGLNSGGLYTSHDGGESWVLEPLFLTRIPRVSFDRDGRLYVVSNGPAPNPNPEGLYRRETNGLWTLLGPTMTNLYETDLHWFRTGQHDPNLILTAGGDYENNGFALSMWRSTDAGAHWTKVVRIPNSSFFRGDGIFLDDGTDDVAIVSLPTEAAPALLRSVDRGASWTPAMAGLPAGFWPWTLSFVPSHPERVYLSSLSSNWIYRSDDAGRQWRYISPTGPFFKLLCDPQNEQVLYGIRSTGFPTGLPVRSKDAGATFLSFVDGPDPIPSFSRVSLAGGDCPTLLAATSFGAFARSGDASPPTIDAHASPSSLWPPDHRMVDVHVDLSIADACDPSPSFVLASITADGSAAEGDVEGASFGTPDTDFRLRATRSGDSEGRSYTITYRGTDASGNTSEVALIVQVPHDRSDTRPVERGDLPLVTSLTGVSPSPFAASTTVSFDLAAERSVRVRVLDVRGALVRTLLDGVRTAGHHRIAWDGRDRDGQALPNGVYWVAFEGADRPQGQRIVLIR